MISVSEPPTDCPQRDAWIAVATYGHPPTEWEFHHSKAGLLIEIDKPEHAEIIRGLKPEGARLREDKECMSFTARLWPWETVPSIRGVGPLFFVEEGAYLPRMTSSDIIKIFGGIP